MTRAEFDARASEPCQACGCEVALEDNPNNGATQVVCSSGICRLARRPWGQVVNIKKRARKTRKPLPNGETLDSIWAKWGDICFLCGAPKAGLALIGIGRQVHHVLPHAQNGHQGPLVPICTQCHPVVNERQRLYWFMVRLAGKGSAANEAVEERPETRKDGPQAA